MSVDNPFYHRGAIRQAEHFYGREAEIAEILSLLRNGQSVSIIGPRRIGKSSLLMHLCRPATRVPLDLAPPKTLFVLIDCQELGGCPPEEVYEAFFYGLQDAAEAINIDLQPRGEIGTYRNVDRAINQVSQNETSVVLLLDEFELLAANEQLTPHFFARLRGLTTKYGLAYITASQRPLYAITADEKVLSSPFFNIFVTISLGLFSDADAHQLINNRLIGTDIECSAAQRQYLIDLVGTHPFFLHVAGYHLFQLLEQGEQLDTPEQLSVIDAAVEIESESHLHYLWNNLTADEQYALATSEGAIDVIRMLEQQCLLHKVGEEGHVTTSNVLRRYVRRQKVEGLIQAGPFVIDPLRHQVKTGTQSVSLTTSQFDLLTRLGGRFGQVVHGDELEQAVWGEVLVDDPDRLKTLIKRLRRAIEPYNDWIVSERGVGYALRPPETIG